VEEYLNLPASKEEKCNKETGKILPGSIENTPKPTAPTGNASLIFNGQPITLQRYARLSKAKRRKCARETRAIWPAETVSLLTTIPEAKMVLRAPAKPLLEESHVEPTKSQTCHAEAAKTMARVPGNQGLVLRGKPLSWREYIRLDKNDQIVALEETLEFLRGRNDATKVIKNILQKAVDLITFRKFSQNLADKDVSNAVKAWWKVFVEFEKYQKDILGRPEPRITGLVDKGKPLPWTVYMAYQKTARTDVILQTWSFHGDLRKKGFPTSHVMAEVMWNIRKETEEYILHLRADYEDAEVVVAKTWKAWTVLTTEFRKQAGKRQLFADMYAEYQKKPPVNPKTRVDPEAILDGIRVRKIGLWHPKVKGRKVV
jgi:hypothetical protein